MDTIFRLVLMTSLYSSIVGIITIMLKLILKNKLNPKWHYAIWVVFILKLLIPYGPKSSLSLFNRVPELSVQTNFTNVYKTYNISSTLIHQGSVALPKASEGQSTTLSLVTKAESLLPYLWFACAMLMLIWLIFASFSLYRGIRSSKALSNESIEHTLEDCKQRLGIKKFIKLVNQDFITTPSILGIYKPIILITPEICVFDNKAISYILLHELAHYKRKDFAINVLLLLFQSIHWFNPIIWYCFKRIRQDMELAADEQVLSLLENSEQKEYGRVLISLIENFSYPKFTPRLICVVDNKKNIEERIRKIKMTNFFKNKPKSILLVGTLCISILGSVMLTSALPKNAALLKPTTAQSSSENKKSNVKKTNAIYPKTLDEAVSLKTLSSPKHADNYNAKAAAGAGNLRMRQIIFNGKSVECTITGKLATASLYFKKFLKKDQVSKKKFNGNSLILISDKILSLKDSEANMGAVAGVVEIVGMNTSVNKQLSNYLNKNIGIAITGNLSINLKALRHTPLIMNVSKVLIRH